MEATSGAPKAQAEPAPPPAKKGAHRRGNSLSGLLPMLLPKRTPSLPGKLPPDAAAAGAATSTTQVLPSPYMSAFGCRRLRAFAGPQQGVCWHGGTECLYAAEESARCVWRGLDWNC